MIWIFGYLRSGRLKIVRLDDTDHKIVKILKTNEDMNIGNLLIKTHCKEGQATFRKRCQNLAKKKVLNMKYVEKGGRRYVINLTDKFK